MFFYKKKIQYNEIDYFPYKSLDYEVKAIRFIHKNIDCAFVYSHTVSSYNP